MKKALLALLFLTLSLFAGVKDVDIAQLEAMQKKGVPVIDIRTPEEWRQSGLVPGSHPIMFFAPDGSYDLKGFLAQLKRLGIDKKRPFILVCRSASRTKTLGDFLADKLGYEKVYQLEGGILNWMAHRKPLEPYRR
ncbi:rhodanese-like domain-containing protein [Hydrogenimonas sp.]